MVCRRTRNATHPGHAITPLCAGCRARFDFLKQLPGGCRDVIAVLIDPAGGVVDRGRSAGDYEKTSAKVGRQVTSAFLIELQPFENRPDSLWNPAFLPARRDGFRGRATLAPEFRRKPPQSDGIERKMRQADAWDRWFAVVVPELSAAPVHRAVSALTPEGFRAISRWLPRSGYHRNADDQRAHPKVVAAVHKGGFVPSDL